MFKKYIAIFCIYVSYIILLGHNIFPHSHSKTDNTAEHHKHHKGIGHLFDHFLHSGDSFVTTKVNYKIDASSIDYSIGILPVGFSIHGDVIQTQLIFPPPETAFDYISPYWSSSGLRAPPFTT
jgi:hypothetical protein